MFFLYNANKPELGYMDVKLITTNTEGKIRDWSANVCKFFGITEEEKMGYKEAVAYFNRFTDPSNFHRELIDEEKGTSICGDISAEYGLSVNEIRLVISNPLDSSNVWRSDSNKTVKDY
jgi:PAS domain-containing protein